MKLCCFTKQSFWSQLLLGMLAIIALPTTGQSHQENIVSTQIEKPLVLKQQIFQRVNRSQYQIAPIFNSAKLIDIIIAKISYLSPHFSAIWYKSQPIRAGPST